jgi:tight adherence protein C
MLLIAIMITLFAAVAFFVVGILTRPKASLMESRIHSFRNRTRLRDDMSIDLDIAFADRVLKPGIESLAQAMTSILPKSVLADIQKQLTMAGNPMRYSTFMVFWGLTLVSCILLAVLLMAAMPGALFPNKLGAVAVVLFIGYNVPRMWLKGKVKAKQKAVIRALPDALDLITTCVEAGLGLDAALSRVAEKGEGPLAEELQRMLRDVAMGKLRREAMTELAERVGVEELTNFINSIIQAEQLGVGIAQVLRVQSDQMRTARRQRAERQAHEAPIKMMFPLVLFIFPAFLAVILGPAVIRVVQAF